MTDQESLGFELPPIVGVADSLCVMLHGYGADGSDMIGVASVMANILPTTHFVAPNAPEPCDTAPGYYQWYAPLGGRQLADIASTTLAPRINQYADMQLERLGLDDSRLIMLGFSQGGGLMIEAALKRTSGCAALLSYTSALRNRGTLEQDIRCRPPTMLIHGELDEVVPVRHVIKAAETLEHHGLAVQTHICGGIGHTLNEEGAFVGAMFISDILSQADLEG